MWKVEVHTFPRPSSEEVYRALQPYVTWIACCQIATYHAFALAIANTLYVIVSLMFLKGQASTICGYLAIVSVVVPFIAYPLWRFLEYRVRKNFRMRFSVRVDNPGFPF